MLMHAHAECTRISYLPRTGREAGYDTMPADNYEKKSELSDNTVTMQCE